MPAGHGWDEGLRVGQRVLRIVEPPGADDSNPVAIEVERDGRAAIVRAASPTRGTDTSRWSLPLLGATFITLGSLVLARRPGLKTARSFWAFCVIVAITAVVAPASGTRAPAWALVLQVPLLFLLPLALLRFFRDLAQAPVRAIERLLAASGAICAAAIVGYLLVVALAPNLYSAIRGAQAIYFFVVMAIALAALAIARRRAQAPAERSVSGVLAVSAGIGLAPLVLLYFVPMALGWKTVPADLTALAMAAIPAGFTYSVLRHQILGIRRLVRRGAVYAGVFAVLLGSVVLVIWLVSLVVSLDHPIAGGELWLLGGASALGALLISILYPQTRRWLDRWVYRDLYDYAEAVRGISREAQVSTQPRAVVIRILEQVAALMGIEGYLLAEDVDAAPSEVLSGGPAAPRLRRAMPAPGFVPVRGTSLKDLDGEPVLAMRFSEETALWLGPKVGGEAFRRDDINLAEPLGTLVGMLLARLQLASELRDLNGRLIAAEEEERARLAMDVHDGPLQKAIYLAKPSLSGEEVLRTAQSLARELRAISTSLRPPALDDLGLYYAVEWLAHSVAEQHAIEVAFDGESFPEDTRLDKTVEIALYRSIQESLTNVAKHAQADRALVTLALEGETVTAVVSDTGIGMDTSRLRQAAMEGHLGLVGVRERLGQVGGSLRVKSEKGAGTTVSMVVSMGTRQHTAAGRP